MTYDSKAGAVYLNVLNRSEKMDIATRIDNAVGKLGGAVGVWELNYADLKATHTFGDDRKVRPAIRTFEASPSENGFVHTFPKHSLTILKLAVQ